MVHNFGRTVIMNCGAGSCLPTGRQRSGKPTDIGSVVEIPDDLNHAFGLCLWPLCILGAASKLVGGFVVAHGVRRMPFREVSPAIDRLSALEVHLDEAGHL